jgi:hypothetical protein
MMYSVHLIDEHCPPLIFPALWQPLRLPESPELAGLWLTDGAATSLGLFSVRQTYVLHIDI